MSATLLITCISLASAVVFTVAAERTPSRRERAGKRYAIAAIFCGYGVCVGVLAMIIEHLFPSPEWAALAIALPLGFPALLLAGKMGEA